MVLVFKICSSSAWRDAETSGVFRGAGVDLDDRFIHLSTAQQVRETARRHFAQGDDLVLVAFDDTTLPGLLYEPSRGGALFPHVHGSISTNAALWVRTLPRLADGSLQFPDSIA
jgi:uncharacterized protein (DUF952 family)